MVVDYRCQPFRRKSAVAAPRRPLNPLLRRAVRRSGKSTVSLSAVAAFTHKQSLYAVLSEERVRATPLLVERLQRLADAVGFPRDEIFLDEVGR